MTGEKKRIIRSLRHAGYGIRDRNGCFLDDVDWGAVKRDYGREIRPGLLYLYGDHLHAKLGEILDGMDIPDSSTPQAVNCCEICRKFHNNGHGGLS